jgi:hypothetical protein
MSGIRLGDLADLYQRASSAVFGDGPSVSQQLATAFPQPLDAGRPGQTVAQAAPAPTSLTPRQMDLVSNLTSFGGVINAFHGSPHLFDRFSLDKVGTGEGVRTYGHGMYFAEDPKVAEGYKQGGGALYDVKLDVNPEDLLHWDKPLSEQSPGVQKKIAALGQKRRGGLMGWLLAQDHDPTVASLAEARRADATGGEIYEALRTGSFENMNPEEMLLRRKAVGAPEASAALHQAGIPGIRYLDAASRGAGDGTHNVVMFDPNLIDITARNGQPVGIQVGR